ncbi:MAG: hypothetical protein Q8S01_06185 [Ignavibacteria bacterium]|nr:hypothetical protein [Ignavibacteria bacterium]
MNEKIYIWIIGGLLSLVNFLFWSRIKRIEKDLEDEKKKSSSIEKNYISRFEELHSKLNEVEKNIIREIYGVRLSAVSASASLSTSSQPSAKSE